MYTGEYKGDSPGKKVSRLGTWIHMRKIHGILNIPYHGTLVLGGHGGDISALMGLNFEPESITSIDLDEDLVAQIKTDYPQVNSVCGEAGTASRKVRYNMAHLDFCGSLSADNIKTVADVVENTWTHPTIMAVTMLKGREHLGSPTATILEGVDRNRRRQLLRDAMKKNCRLGKLLLTGMKCHCEKGRPKRLTLGDVCPRCKAKIGYFEPMKMIDIAEDIIMNEIGKGVAIGNEGGLWEGELKVVRKPKDEDAFVDLGYLTKRGKIGPLSKAISRAIALQRIVDWLVHARGNIENEVGEPVGLRLMGVTGYHSREKGGKGGTPFLTAYYLIRRASQDTGLMQGMAQFMGRQGMQLGNAFTTKDIKTCTESLEPTAVVLAKLHSNETVGKLLSIDPRRLPAWKAHSTMGTYDGITPAFSHNPDSEYWTPKGTFRPFIRCDPDNPHGIVEDLWRKSLQLYCDY